MRSEVSKIFREIETRAANRSTILLTHQRVWIGLPDTKKLMKFLSGRVDYIIAGDSGVEFLTSTTSSGIEVFEVGMGMPRRDPPHTVFFAVGRIGADGVLGMEPVVLDIPDDHAWRSEEGAERVRGRRAASKKGPSS